MPIYKKHAKTLSTLKGINLKIFFLRRLAARSHFTQDIEEQDMLFDMDKILALKVA